MKLRMFGSILALLTLGSLQSVWADQVVWGNSASGGSPRLEAFNINGAGVATLVPGQEFLLPAAGAQADGNGRGVAVLGNDIYYTTASSGLIWKTNAISHADLGVLVNTGFAGIANVATDGTFLYATDYQVNNGSINKYSTAGVLQGSITLTGADAAGSGHNGRDGFEVQNNPNIKGGALTFIANRYDGGFGQTNGNIIAGYDVYDSNGVEIISGFIKPNAQGISGATGIAYDGTDYFVSDVFGNRLAEYDGNGTFLKFINLAGIPSPFGTRELEDLSAVGNTINNPPPGVPEPTSLLLLGTALVGFGASRWNKRRTNS